MPRRPQALFHAQLAEFSSIFHEVVINPLD